MQTRPQCTLQLFPWSIRGLQGEIGANKEGAVSENTGTVQWFVWSALNFSRVRFKAGKPRCWQRRISEQGCIVLSGRLQSHSEHKYNRTP